MRRGCDRRAGRQGLLCRILELSGPVIAREHHQEQDWNEHAGSLENPSSSRQQSPVK